MRLKKLHKFNMITKDFYYFLKHCVIFMQVSAPVEVSVDDQSLKAGCATGFKLCLISLYFM